MRYRFHLLAVIFLVAAARGQTTCSALHPDPGVHLCFPSPSGTLELPPLVHISAQLNAPEGKLVSGFTIKVDGETVGVDVERVPTRRLAVEGTLGRPLAAGAHSIRIESSGIGDAQTKVSIQAFHGVVPCSPVSNVPQWVCTALPYKGEPAHGSPFAELQHVPNAEFTQFAQALLQELEALQLDSTEVAALDDAGNIYTATHVLSDIEVRKYGPGGQKLEFATVISSCGPGFTALDAIALADDGQVWIGGHSSACFRPTNSLEQPSPATSNEERSFLLRVNMSRNPSPPPAYFTFLPNAAQTRIAGLRVDHNGTVYIAGTTSSSFPHERVLKLGIGNAISRSQSFIAISKADGTALANSTLLQGVRLTALALNNETVAIAGSAENIPNRNSRASCCAEMLATLPADLSTVTSITRVAQTADSRISALATTSAGELVAVGHAPIRDNASLKNSSFGTTILFWSPDSHQAACSQFVRADIPAVVQTPAVDAYAHVAPSSAFCKARAADKSYSTARSH